MENFSGHSMIYFGPTKWDGLWRNRHQLMSRFARSNKVMYVEPMISLRQLIKGKRGYWGYFKNAMLGGTVRKIRKNLYVYNSSLTPIIGPRNFDNWTWKIWRKKFISILQKLNFDKPIIWLSSPTMASFIDQFNEKISIYHVVDEYSEYRGANKSYMLELEKQIFKKADLVIVVSKKLLEEKKKLHPKVHMIPNGVDYDAYDNVIRSVKNTPDEMSNLCRPIIGYSGLISYRLDLDIIRQTAQKFPNGSIVLIGSIDDRGCEIKIAQLKKMPNIHFLGIKPIEKVPEYIVAFDVSIIPYANNGEVENLSPLKLYDSMAAGKPIVTTDFPAAHEFKDLIYITNTKEQFIDNIKLALNESDIKIAQARRRVASKNTWDDRIDQISDILYPLTNKFQ